MSDAVGVITLVTSAGESVWTPAFVRALSVRSARSMFRAPFGTAWHVLGEPRRGVERYEVEALVLAEGATLIANASDARDDLQTTLAAATELRSRTFGRLLVDGLESFTSSPVVGGYRVKATLIGRNPLALIVVSVTTTATDRVATLIAGAGFAVQTVSPDEAISRFDEADLIAVANTADGSVYGLNAPLLVPQNADEGLITAGLTTGLPSEGLMFSYYNGVDVLASAAGHPIVGGLSGLVRLTEEDLGGGGPSELGVLAVGTTPLTVGPSVSSNVIHMAGVTTHGKRAATFVPGAYTYTTTASADALTRNAALWAVGRL